MRLLSSAIAGGDGMETDADGWGTDGFSLAGGSRWGVADVGRLEINIYAIAAVACV